MSPKLGGVFGGSQGSDTGCTEPVGFQQALQARGIGCARRIVAHVAVQVRVTGRDPKGSWLSQPPVDRIRRPAPGRTVAPSRYPARLPVYLYRSPYDALLSLNTLPNASYVIVSCEVARIIRQVLHGAFPIGEIPGRCPAGSAGDPRKSWSRRRRGDSAFAGHWSR